MRAHSDFGETVALYRLVDSAELPQVKTLLSEAQAISQPSQRYGAQTIIYQKYVELDPIAALESVQLNDPQGTGTLSVAVMRMWAEHDIEAAVAYVKELEGRVTTIGNPITRLRGSIRFDRFRRTGVA